mgnify:CR=1 FL=1
MITHTKEEILNIIKSYPCLEFFLKKHKVYTKYIKYSMDPKWGEDIDYINKPFSPDIISFSFLFASTNEGSNFWWRLNTLYSTIYNEYI